ncbi:hypothetical protein [Bradyrhizobium sp. sGM-13]|uniref:hypothetical protein n=1 Tax=Bradyrhizobium sp. sGM-13 TaxID=2831781 RepID=UPI001BCE410A|nr:hypothetical protein [Bradyrhizobium sp. sGM-13]
MPVIGSVALWIGVRAADVAPSRSFSAWMATKTFFVDLADGLCFACADSTQYLIEHARNPMSKPIWARRPPMQVLFELSRLRNLNPAFCEVSSYDDALGNARRVATRKPQPAIIIGTRPTGTTRSW